MQRFLMCLLWCLSVSVASGEVIISHEGATNPLDEGWYLMSGVPGAPDEDSWRIITMGYGRYGPAVDLTPDNFAGDWWLEFEMKYNAGALAESRCTIFDPLRNKSTAWTWDDTGAYIYVGGQGDTLVSTDDPYGWHLHELEWDNEHQELGIYIDGMHVETLSGDRYNNTGGQSIFYWGDNLGGGEISDTQWRSITFDDGQPTIPEPCSWLLIITGGLFWLLLLPWHRLRR